MEARRTFCIPQPTLREQAVAPLSAYPGICEVCFAPMNGHRETPLSSPKSATDRDRGEPRGSAPPTPPYVRVRIRRFEKNANALRSNDSTRVGWAFGFMHHRERFDVFPQRLPGFTRRRR